MVKAQVEGLRLPWGEKRAGGGKMM